MEISNYQIAETLGSGGMATVYKAYQPKLDRHVAIKVLHPNIAQDANFLARFEREARIVARLEHPYIVPIYDFDEANGQPYLVMKYVEGYTLKDLLKSHRLNNDSILDLVKKIGKALSYAHQQGILHRDLKPSNILVDERGEPFLTDFGLARIAQQGESTMSVDVMLGTPHYISPEQAQGKTDLDQRTDIYSFGIILYEMATGRVPFVGDTSYGIIHDQIYTPPPPPSEINPNVSPEVEAVILRALTKNRDDRYSTVDELVGDFTRAFNGEAAAPKPKRTTTATTTPIDNLRQQARSNFEDARQSVTSSLQDAGVSVRVSLQDAWREIRNNPEIGRFIPHKDAKWQTAPDGKSGFYTEVEIRELESNLSVDEQIRRRVERRMKAREEFTNHVTAYVLVNLFLWVIWFLTDPGGFMWPMFPMAGWGIGLGFHWLDYYTKHGGGSRRREEFIQREMEREMDLMGMKRKNESYDGHIRLTEDGELTESFVDDQQERRRNG